MHWRALNTVGMAFCVVLTFFFEYLSLGGKQASTFTKNEGLICALVLIVMSDTNSG